MISFEKYHGAGNDFILIDNRNSGIHLTNKQIELLCNRHFGIGADGVILIQLKEGYDFEMIYYNADGGLGSMCGNGGRCAVIFAHKLGMIDKSASFLAFDGEHKAISNSDDVVKLSMANVTGIENSDDQIILNTGSPHYVKFVEDVNGADVVKEGREVRFGDRFRKEGINVNFASVNGDTIQMRTYERGVEAETLSCGTGTVAVAMAVAVMRKQMNQQEISIQAPGGKLKVHFNRTSEDVFEDVWLEGPATFVFAGKIEI